MLAKTPENDILLRLRQDLSSVIDMTRELLESKNSASSVTAAVDDDEPPPLPDLSGPQSVTHGENKWNVGDRCMAPWDDGDLYHARVEAVKDADTLTVTFLAYGNQVEVSVATIRPYKSALEAELKPGALVRAVYPGDGLFYDATVVEKGDPGLYRVRFAKWKKNANNKKMYDIPAYDMIIRAAGADDEEDEDLPERPTIPDHLKSRSEDTEAQRLQKKKKVKLLKQRHKDKVITQDRQRKQNNWLGFHQGVATAINKKKKSSEAINFKFIQNRKSIFAAPTSVAGRVGVTGSDQEMTPEQRRAKHVYNPSAPAGASPFIPPQ